MHLSLSVDKDYTLGISEECPDHADCILSAQLNAGVHEPRAVFLTPEAQLV